MQKTHAKQPSIMQPYQFQHGLWENFCVPYLSPKYVERFSFLVRYLKEPSIHFNREDPISDRIKGPATSYPLCFASTAQRNMSADASMVKLFCGPDPLKPEDVSLLVRSLPPSLRILAITLSHTLHLTCPPPSSFISTVSKRRSRLHQVRSSSYRTKFRWRISRQSLRIGADRHVQGNESAFCRQDAAARGGGSVEGQPDTSIVPKDCLQ
jgi:hypothetical protein